MARKPEASVPMRESVSVDQGTNKSYVWYASYASNMCAARFLCYIHGGQAEGMARACNGATDRTPPVASHWARIPHELVFGREWTPTWGCGGVAFLNPISSDSSPLTVIRMYKITLQQFCDVLAQENRMNPENSNLALNWNQIISLKRQLAEPHHGTYEFLPNSWYGTVKYLGEETGLPILTITCSIADMKQYQDGRLPRSPPSAGYSSVVVKGLVEYGLSEEDAQRYIHSRC